MNLKVVTCSCLKKITTQFIGKPIQKNMQGYLLQ